VQRAQPADDVLGPLVHHILGKDQVVVVHSTVGLEQLREERDLPWLHVVPEEVVTGVQRNLQLPRDGQGPLEGHVLTVEPPVHTLGVGGAHVLLPPLRGVRAWHQGVVVLQELAEGDEHLAHIVEGAYGGSVLLGLLHRVDLHQVAVLEQGDGALDGVARGDGARLAGSLDLELGADGHEAVQCHHGGGAHRDGRQARGTCATVPKAEAPLAGWMGQHRSARD
jgi:hypothetical protein